LLCDPAPFAQSRRFVLHQRTSQPARPGGGPGTGAQGPAGAQASSRSRDFGVLALCLLAPIWGYGWVASKVGLEYSQPLTYTTLRVALTAVALFLLMVVLRRGLRPPPLLWIIPIALLQTTAFVGLTTWALQGGGAGKVAVLCYTMPFWLLLLAWGFLGERLHDVQWLAVIVALAGLILVVSPWRIQGVFSSVLTLLGGFAWAAAGLLVKLLQRRHDVDLLSLTTWQMVIGAVPLVAVALLTHQPAPQWTATFTATLAYNVLLANAVAWLLWLYALRVLPTGAAGLGTLAVPVVGVFAAWLQLGEKPGGAEAVGMVLIVAALAVISVRGYVVSRAAGVAGTLEALGDVPSQPQTD
jgi:drug/metabolite transporter (DMT)-like permease